MVSNLITITTFLLVIIAFNRAGLLTTDARKWSIVPIAGIISIIPVLNVAAIGISLLSMVIDNVATKIKNFFTH